jgi:actin-like ATPase involved in cell morphogenesis
MAKRFPPEIRSELLDCFPIIHAEDPLSCVALGTGKALDQIDLLRTVAMH